MFIIGARELFFYGRFEEAAKLFRRHLTMPESIWPPERAWSMRYLAKIYPTEAEHWLMHACAEYPNGAEVWTDLAKYYYNKSNWFGMYFAAKRSLDCQLNKGLYLSEPESYGWWPQDMAALSAYRLGYFKEALHHGQIALSLNPNDQRLKDNLIWYKRALAGVTVVIPTKSNISGLTALTASLMSSQGVSRVIVVGDGFETAPILKTLPDSIIKIYVPRGSGITKMWAEGMKLANEGDYVLFINDDVTIDTDTVSGLVDTLINNEQVGLVCPHYANTKAESDIQTTTTCQGKYDGTGGMAGFCMMLAADLVPQLKWPTEIRWWWSDNYLVDWVNKKKNRLCVISSKVKCHHAHSQTIENDPPEDFNNIILKDKEIYKQLTKGW